MTGPVANAAGARGEVVRQAHRHGSRPEHQEHSRALPGWARAVDAAALVLIAVVLAGGFLSSGYAGDSVATAWSRLGCGVLGVWGLAAWAFGRWNDEGLRPSVWLLGLLCGWLVWALVLQVPLPRGIVTAISPAWREAVEAMQAAGIQPPRRVPLGQAPEHGWSSWNQMLAATALFGALAILSVRRTGARWLIWMVAAVGLVEGFLGLYYYVVSDRGRAYGALYNSNHHATFVFMTIPVALALAAQFRERLRAERHGGSIANVSLPIHGVLGLAILGAVASLSRAALLIDGGILLAWLAIEKLGSARESGSAEDGGQGSLWSSNRELALVAAGLVLLALFGAVNEGFSSRFGKFDRDLGSRRAMAAAALDGLSESRFLGVGLRGTETVINKFYALPTISQPVHAHNDWVQVFAELGVPGMFILLAMVTGLGVVLFKRSRRREGHVSWNEASFERAAWAGVFIALAHALSDFHLRVPLFHYVFLILLALAVNRGAVVLMQSRRKVRRRS